MILQNLIFSQEAWRQKKEKKKRKERKSGVQIKSFERFEGPKKGKEKQENDAKKKERNKAGYTAQDAPRTRTFHLRKKHGTDRQTDGWMDTTSYRDATAHLKMNYILYKEAKDYRKKRRYHTHLLSIQMPSGQINGNKDSFAAKATWRHAGCVETSYANPSTSNLASTGTFQLQQSQICCINNIKCNVTVNSDCAMYSLRLSMYQILTELKLPDSLHFVLHL